MSAADSGVRPRDAYGQAVPRPRGRAAHRSRESAGTPWHMMTRPLKVEGKARGANVRAADAAAVPAARAPTSALFEGDFDLGLAAFCRGAGIDPRNISSEARGAALQLAGQLLREAVLGLMDLNQGRNEFRNRFRMSAAGRRRRPGVALEFFARRR